MIGRIVLPKVTGVSLNDRFSHLRELREQQQQQQQHVQRAQVVSSAENRRLAEQMENRPAVRAALSGNRGLRAGGNASGGGGPAQKRMHVKQRLAIQARLGVLKSAAARGAVGGHLAGRGRSILKRLQLPRGGLAALQSRTRGGATAAARGRGRGRGRGITTRGRGGGIVSSARGRGGAAVGARGRAGRGRGQVRGRGRGRGAAQVQVSRDDLDKQLDEYMASTKSHLDAELDAYMKDAEL